MYNNILVTGGAGFIGSAFIRYGIAHYPFLKKIVNLDLLTYAANLESLSSLSGDPRYLFVEGDVGDTSSVHALCRLHAIEAIVHFAAESHVDRSIAHARPFIDTNICGTYSLLEVIRALPHLHFHQVSTDEVFGSLPSRSATEEFPYKPSSPYAASKAAADHLVRSWAHTYSLSTTLSHCTNNYGPYQDGEKFIPRLIQCQLRGDPLPLYGEGLNVRDWLFVDDHVEALWLILERGKRGESYNIGGECEKKNIELLKEICLYMGCSTPNIAKIQDRLGHDLRYSLNCSKIKEELGWRQRHTFHEGILKTIAWYGDQK